MIEIMRSLHEHYAPPNEPFGKRLETLFIGMTLVLGQIEGRPFSVSKVAAYMKIPRTTVIRRLGRLHKWGLLHREGLHYYVHPDALNSMMGMDSYRQIRRTVKKATGKLSILDSYPPGRP
jgi:hypothetical protein